MTATLTPTTGLTTASITASATAGTRARPVPVAASTPVDDRDLVARLGGGDREALGELYRRYRDKVSGYVRRRIAVEADTDDVVHETFLRAIRAAGDYRPEQGREVRSWLCGLAAWQLRDYARKDRWPYLAAVDATREALARPGIESSQERENRTLSEPVRAAVARLTPAEQRAIQLRYLDGLSGTDAADRAGSSRSTIHTNAMTARRKLARMLADQAPTATSPVQELRPGQAIAAALTAVGYDHPAAAQDWLRQRGVHVSKSHVYNIRNRGPQPTDQHDQQAARPGAAADTSQRHAQPDHTDTSRDADQSAQARPRPRVTEQTEQHHRSPAAHSTPPAAGGQPATRRGSAAPDSAGRRGDESAATAAIAARGAATGPPVVEVSIARARVAVAVLRAHRAEQDQRRAAEQARTDRLNHWRHDDQHHHASTGRVDEREGHAR